MNVLKTVISRFSPGRVTRSFRIGPSCSGCPPRAASPCFRIGVILAFVYFLTASAAMCQATAPNRFGAGLRASGGPTFVASDRRKSITAVNEAQNTLSAVLSRESGPDRFGPGLCASAGHGLETSDRQAATSRATGPDCFGPGLRANGSRSFRPSDHRKGAP